MDLGLTLVTALLLAHMPQATPPALTPVGKLIGSVKNQHGTAITAAKVRALDIANPPKAFQATIEKGIFSVTVPPGYYCLEASATGYESARTNITEVAPSVTVTVDVQLWEQTSWIDSIPRSAWTLIGLFFTMSGLASSMIYPYFRAWKDRPKLKVKAQPTKPYSHRFKRQFPLSAKQAVASVPAGVIGNGFAAVIGFYFIRIQVTNEGTRDEAEDVDISINRIGEINGKDVRDFENFIPSNLRWSNTWNIAKAKSDKGSDSNVLVKSRISASNGQRYCDLGFIVDPEQLEKFCQITSVGQRDEGALPKKGDVLFMLATEYIRPWAPRSLKPGEYWLELLCDAKNMKPQLFWLRLTIPQAFDFGSGNIEICCKDKRPEELAGWKS